MLDLNKLKVPDSRAEDERLLVRRVQRVKFMKALTEFCDLKGSPLTKLPAVSGRELDLHLLYIQVRKRGGYEKACDTRKWSDIAEAMNMHDTDTKTLAAALKKHYQQLLLPYERCEKGLDPPPPPRPVADKPAPAATEKEEKAEAADGDVKMEDEGGAATTTADTTTPPQLTAASHLLPPPRSPRSRRHQWSRRAAA